MLRRTLTGVILGAVAIALVACGGSGSDGGGPTASASPTPAPVTASPTATPDCSYGGPSIQVVDVATAEATIVAQGHMPSWSPSGESIAFVAVGSGDCKGEWGLFVVNSATGAERRIRETTTGGLWYSWSPDGSSIALAVDESTPSDVEGRIELIDVGAGSLREIFRGGAVADVVWSANGRRLAFGYESDDDAWRVRVVDPSGGVIADTALGGAERRVTRVALSPDGGNVAFAAFEADFKGNPIRYYLYVGPVEGEPVLVLETERSLGELAWSSDGGAVVVTAASLDEFEIYTVRADGTGLQRVGDGWQPAWAPDANDLAFVDDPCGNPVASVVASDGSGLRAVAPDLDGYTLDVLWSPVGDQIAITVAGGSDEGLYVVERDGSDLRVLVDEYRDSVSWSPDGSRLAGTPPLGRDICLFF